MPLNKILEIKTNGSNTLLDHKFTDESLSDRHQWGILLGLLIDSVGIDKPETTASHLTNLAFHISRSHLPVTVLQLFYSCTVKHLDHIPPFPRSPFLKKWVTCVPSPRGPEGAHETRCMASTMGLRKRQIRPHEANDVYSGTRFQFQIHTTALRRLGFYYGP
jgi:hypothetical protein